MPFPDDDAVFENVTVHGDLIVGTTPEGPYIWAKVDGTGNPVLLFQPATNATYSNGAQFTDVDGNNTPVLSLRGPRFNGERQSIINLFGSNDALGIRPNVVIAVDNGELQVTHAGDFHILGLGYCRDATSLGDSASVNAETVVATIPNMAFRDGRAYRVSYGHIVQSDIANGEAVFKLRKTNAAGTIYGDGGRIVMPLAAPANYPGDGGWYIRRLFGAGDLTTDVVLTIESFTALGNVKQRGSATTPRYLLIEDCGSANQYQFAVAVT